MRECSLLLLLAEVLLLALLKSGLRLGRRAVAISKQFLCWFSRSAAEEIHKPPSKATISVIVMKVRITTDVCTSVSTVS